MRQWAQPPKKSWQYSWWCAGFCLSPPDFQKKPLSFYFPGGMYVDLHPLGNAGHKNILSWSIKLVLQEKKKNFAGSEKPTFTLIKEKEPLWYRGVLCIIFVISFPFLQLFAWRTGHTFKQGKAHSCWQERASENFRDLQNDCSEWGSVQTLCQFATIHGPRLVWCTNTARSRTHNLFFYWQKHTATSFLWNQAYQ